jgi:hypothetical protein
MLTPKRLNYGVDLLVGAAPFAGGGGGGAAGEDFGLLAGDAAAAGELVVAGEALIAGEAAIAGEALLLAPGIAAPSTWTRSLTA